MNYQNVYDRLIEHYRNNVLEEHYEVHHIIPVCLGGKNTSNNLVRLSLRAHFVAHLLLTKIYKTHQGLALAAFMMSARKSIKSSRNYEWLRRKVSQHKKGKPAHNKGKPSTLKGRPGTPHTDETKRKLSEARKGKKTGPCSDKRKANIQKALLGHKHSLETKRKISESRSGQKDTEETRLNKSKAQKGRKHTTETRRKISEAQKGNKRGSATEEIKNKIRKTKQQYEYHTPYGTFISLREIEKEIPEDITAEGIRHRINSNLHHWKHWYKIDITRNTHVRI